MTVIVCASYSKKRKRGLYGIELMELGPQLPEALYMSLKQDPTYGSEFEKCRCDAYIYIKRSK